MILKLFVIFHLLKCIIRVTWRTEFLKQPMLFGLSTIHSLSCRNVWTVLQSMNFPMLSNNENRFTFLSSFKTKRSEEIMILIMCRHVYSSSSFSLCSVRIFLSSSGSIHYWIQLQRMDGIQC